MIENPTNETCNLLAVVVEVVVLVVVCVPSNNDFDRTAAGLEWTNVELDSKN